MPRLIAILILVAAFLASRPATAGDLVLARAALEDPAGTLTPGEAMDGAFQPIGTVLAKGYTHSVHWVRLLVRKPDQGDEVVLAIRQPFLNEITLFEPGAGPGGGWRSRVTGNAYPFRDRDRSRSSLGFRVHVTSPSATFYLRLRTSTASQLTVEGLTPAEAEHRDDQMDLLAGIFVTAMGLLLLWAIHSYLVDRLRVLGFFALHQAVYTLFGLALTGYLAPWIPAGFCRWTDGMTAVLYCGVSFTIVLFCRELFRPYEPPPLLMRGLDLLLLAFPLELAAMALGRVPLAAICNLVLVRFMWGYFVLVAFSLRRELSPSRRMVRTVIVSVTLVFTAFWVAGGSPLFIRNPWMSRLVLITNGLIIGLLFAMILNARSRRLLLEARESALALQARAEFLALVSHEIRTPLSALVGFSALARRDPRHLDQHLAIVEESSRSLMQLVDNILDMSKLEAGRLSLEAIPLDLRCLADSLEAQYGALARQKGLTFRMELPGDAAGWGLGDPLRLRQILANLLANAIKFTATGSVTCSLGRAGAGEGGRLRMEVADTGAGIPMGFQAQVFQPFRQVDASTSRTFGGTGLGLAIVHSLVTRMGGAILLDSEEGRGSRFQIDVPFPDAEAPSADSADPFRFAVLVVEDQAFNRLLLADLLTASGHLATLASGGMEALALLESQTFDLILLDIRMPGMDGLEVARRIRSLEKERKAQPVGIVAITADSDAALLEAGRAAGIQEFLTKPVHPDQLARVMVRHASSLHRPLDLRTLAGLGDLSSRVKALHLALASDIGEEMRKLEEALACGDRLGLGRCAHALKGLCGHLADPELAEGAGWLQSHASAAPFEKLEEGADCLRTLYRRTQELMTSLP